jgi:hypothetical protein
MRLPQPHRTAGTCRDAEKQVKGSQGAGKVDDALDRTKGPASPVSSPSKPALPPRGKGKGKR